MNFKKKNGFERASPFKTAKSRNPETYFKVKHHLNPSLKKMSLFLYLQYLITWREKFTRCRTFYRKTLENSYAIKNFKCLLKEKVFRFERGWFISSAFLCKKTPSNWRLKVIVADFEIYVCTQNFVNLDSFLLLQ